MTTAALGSVNQPGSSIWPIATTGRGVTVGVRVAVGRGAVGEGVKVGVAVATGVGGEVAVWTGTVGAGAVLLAVVVAVAAGVMTVAAEDWLSPRD